MDGLFYEDGGVFSPRKSGRPPVISRQLERWAAHHLGKVSVVSWSWIAIALGRLFCHPASILELVIWIFGDTVADSNAVDQLCLGPASRASRSQMARNIPAIVRACDCFFGGLVGNGIHGDGLDVCRSRRRLDADPITSKWCLRVAIGYLDKVYCPKSR